MKSTIAAAALFAAVASAQSIGDLPSCSISCVATAVLGICPSVTDYECACGAADQLTASVTPCVQSACPDAADQAKVITVLEGICAGAGFPITISTPGGGASSTPAPSSTPESTPVSSSVESTPTPESSSSAVYSSVVPSTSSAATVSGYPTPSSNGTVVVSPTPTAYTGAAVANGVTFGAAGLFGLLAYVL